MKVFFRVALAVPLAICASLAEASPWLDVGDSTLRGDVELLAAHGLIDGVTMTWPIPKRQIERGLASSDRLASEPPSVRAAALRVRTALGLDANPTQLHPLADLKATNRAEVIRSFDASARDEFDAKAGGEWSGENESLRLLAGVQTAANGDGGRPSLDGSAASFRDSLIKSHCVE
jgi:hypothetical protein